MKSRLLWIVASLLLLTALLLWFSSLLPWSASNNNGHAFGSVQKTPDGDAALIPLAVLTLAAIAGAVGLSGLFRRALGIVLLCVPALIWWRAIAGPDSSALSPLPTGRILAAAAGLLALSAAILLILFGHRVPRLGSRYRTKGVNGKTGDRDLWRDLDAGTDPTTKD